MTQDSTSPILHTTDLPRRYARALFELSDSSGETLRVSEDFEKFVAAFDANPVLRQLSRNPFASRERLDSILADIAKQLQVCDIFRNFVGVLTRRRRLSQLPNIAHAFEEMLATQQHKTIVEITSASKLSAQQRKALVATLAKHVGGDLKVHDRRDPDLIGGLTVQIGSKLIDGSVATQLRRFRDNALRSAG